MDTRTLKQLLCSNLPLQSKRLKMDLTSVEQLINFRSSYNSSTEFELTCRPVSHIGNLFEHYSTVLNNPNSLFFNISVIELNNIIGRVSLRDYNPRNMSVELGYYILPTCRNKEYAYECIQKLLFEAFKVGINKVYAQTGSFNLASNNLLKKLNFHLDGMLRAHHELNGVLYDDNIYSILKGELLFN